jgi:threonine dehydratase
VTSTLNLQSPVRVSDLESAAQLVYRYFPPTAQITWPLLSTRAGCEVWVKHENHTPVGAFKVRGGLVYCDELRRTHPEVRGLITPTRGNHGQSIAYGAGRFGLTATVVVPHGNSREKNAAMRALGAELIEVGHDFQAAAEHSRRLAQEKGLHLVPSYHPALVRGVASYALELFRAVNDLDTVYVPIGQGSGICGVIAARDALGSRTRIVGVVAEQAAAWALSMEAGKPVATETAETIADGVACRVPGDDAFSVISKGTERVVTVSEAEIRAAMRAYFTDTHNAAEGAGATPLAALLKEKGRMAGKKVGLVLTGGNVDREVYGPALMES